VALTLSSILPQVAGKLERFTINWSDRTLSNVRRKKALSAFFKYQNERLDRCLAPGMVCKERAIRSHSVQNSRVLDLLVQNGHVKTLGKRIDKRIGPVIQFEDIGRHQATTFTGFCSEHDREIFAPIETQPFDPRSRRHLFLAAYRALAKELHAQMEAAYRTQANYNERVRLGLDSGNHPEPHGMVAIEWMMKSYMTHEYKCSFDTALLTEDCNDVCHDVINMDQEAPSIAVCSHFGLDYASESGDWLRVALNVLPLETRESVAVFSYLRRDAPLIQASLSNVLNSTGPQQKYLLSKQILNSCSNFVVSPEHFNSWSTEKRAAITEYFCQTLFESHLDKENELLYLF
jgi:hypothetical protein